MIDRQAQKTDTFTGIVGINTQDRAVQEMMGPIVDRSREHLGPADKAIIVARKLLADAVRTVADGGDPLGVSPTYYGLRAAERCASRGRELARRPDPADGFGAALRESGGAVTLTFGRLSHYS